MEIDIIKRETTGTGPNVYHENDTIAKYEIMDGAPVRGKAPAQALARSVGTARGSTWLKKGVLLTCAFLVSALWMPMKQEESLRLLPHLCREELHFALLYIPGWCLTFSLES